MTKALNLLDVSWLPVRMQSGEIREVGLIALFEEADKIVALAETAPPALMAQYRLLLAITNRALSRTLTRWHERDLVKWFEQGLPTGAITAYLEQWRERFWLFHPEYPFMQVAALETAAETADRFKPWTQIELASASGNAPVVFNHSLDAVPSAITPAAALRSLLGFLQCTPGGLVKVFRDADKAGPLANTAAALPLGNSLAQTLVLGLHPVSPNHQDLPSWERPPLTVAELQAAPTLATGPNDRYTRQTRAVFLLREEDGDIRWLRFAVGQGLEEDPQAPDPMASYRAGSNGPVRLSFSEGRALWRDLPALLPDGVGQSTPAAILEGASRLNRDLERTSLPLLVAGLASDQAKLLRWRAEQLILPQAILQQPDATRVAREMLGKAEELFAKMKGAGVQLIADILPDSQQKDTRSRARALFDVSPVTTLYFAMAERSLMAVLTRIEEEPDEAHKEWQRVLQRAALAAWEALLVSQGGSTHLWRANAKAEPRLRSAIKQQLDALYETGEVQ
jgi:CRISPR system Cascade subunit CasA